MVWLVGLSEVPGKGFTRMFSLQLTGLKPPNTLSREQAEAKYRVQVEDTLASVFKLKSFRPNQEEAIYALLSRKDAFVMLPTGNLEMVRRH